MVKICENCGHENDDEDLFCEDSGKKFMNKEPSEIFDKNNNTLDSSLEVNSLNSIDYDEKIKEINKLNDENSNQKDIIQKLNDKINQLIENNIDKEQELVNLKQKLKTYADEDSNLESVNKNQKTTINNLEKINNQLKSKNEELSKNIKTNNENFNNELNKSKSEINNLTKDYDNKLRKLEDEIENKNININNLKSENNNYIKKIKILNDENLQIKNEQNIINEKYNVLLENNNEYKRTIITHTKDIDDLEETIKQEKKHNTALNQKLNTTLTEKDNQIDELNKELEYNNNSNIKLTKEKLELENEIKNYKIIINKLEQDTQVNTEKEETYNKTINSLKNNINLLNNEIIKLKEIIGTDNLNLIKKYDRINKSTFKI